MLFAGLSLAVWGLWGFFSKLGTSVLSAQNVLVFSIIGSIIGVMITIIALPGPLVMNPRGILYAILSGATSTLGSMFFFLALRKGPTPIIVSITSLYPLVTILLSVLILREAITLRHALGIACALLAMFLFAV